MPRRPRIHLPDLPLHIVQRGQNRDACFFAEAEYLAYREWLGEALKAMGCQLHAYVQMTNHVHLLLTTPTPEAPRKAKGAGQSHSNIKMCIRDSASGDPSYGWFWLCNIT